MSNVNVVTGLTIQAVDITANVTPYNRALQGILLPVTVWASADFLQVLTTGTVITLPAATVWYVYVRNLSANDITLTYTPAGGAATSVVLLPITSSFGGIFLYANTTETGGGGITALSLTAASATSSAEYFVAQ